MCKTVPPSSLDSYLFLWVTDKILSAVLSTSFFHKPYFPTSDFVQWVTLGNTYVMLQQNQW
jgi:hypothetical protein